MVYMTAFFTICLFVLYVLLGFLGFAAGPICLAGSLYLHSKSTDQIRPKRGLFITSLAFFSFTLIALNYKTYEIDSCVYSRAMLGLMVLFYLAFIFFNLKFLVLELKRKEEKSKTYIFYSLSLLIIFLPYILVAVLFTTPYKCGLPF